MNDRRKQDKKDGEKSNRKTSGYPRIEKAAAGGKKERKQEKKK